MRLPDPPPAERPAFTRVEERFHYLSHALGFALCVPAVLLLVLAAARRDTATLVGCAVYGVTLLLMYGASTVYHAVSAEKVRAKRALRLLDHSAIFLLISGSYTPLSLSVLRDAQGYWLLAALWAIALLGMVFVFVQRGPRRGGPVLLYLAMGWAIVPVIPALTRLMGTPALLLLAAGGLTYTLGVPFYAWRKLRFHHAVWHVFVLAGSLLHFLAIARLVGPVAP